MSEGRTTPDEGYTGSSRATGGDDCRKRTARPGTGPEIHEAVRAGDLAKVAALLDEHPSLIHLRDGEGATPLHLAYVLEVATALLAKGARVDTRDKCDRTPLYTAVEEGNRGVAEALLDHGADTAAREKRHGRTPLHAAILRIHKSLVKLLLERGADANARDKSGATPLDLAALSEPRQAIAELLHHHGGKRSASLTSNS